MKKLTKEWFAAAGIRAIRTFAQTAIATIGTAAAIHEVNWIFVLSASALAALLSMLTSLAGLPEVKTEEIDSTDIFAAKVDELETLDEDEEEQGGE